MGKYKYAVGVVLYNPDQNALERVIEYKKIFDKVYIYDNSKEAPYKLLFSENDRIVYFSTGANDGLSVAYNWFLDIARAENIDYLCTMDQDSVYSSEEIEPLKKYIEENDMANVGIVAPLVIWQGNQTKVQRSEKIEEKNFVISSGSFINIEETLEISFDINYFIDRLDKDFCQELIGKRKRILQLHFSVLYQHLGEGTHAEHSAVRHYYMFRNRLYYNHKYHKKTKRLFLNILQTCNQFKDIILYESSKSRKMRTIKYAVIDFRKNAMGKCGRTILE